MNFSSIIAYCKRFIPYVKFLLKMRKKYLKKHGDGGTNFNPKWCPYIKYMWRMHKAFKHDHETTVGVVTNVSSENQEEVINEYAILKAGLARNGIEFYRGQIIEEAAETIQALMHLSRPDRIGSVNNKQLLSELTQLSLMIKVVMDNTFSVDEINSCRYKELKRIQERNIIHFAEEDLSVTLQKRIYLCMRLLMR